MTPACSSGGPLRPSSGQPARGSAPGWAAASQVAVLEASAAQPRPPGLPPPPSQASPAPRRAARAARPSPLPPQLCSPPLTPAATDLLHAAPSPAPSSPRPRGGAPPLTGFPARLLSPAARARCRPGPASLLPCGGFGLPPAAALALVRSVSVSPELDPDGRIAWGTSAGLDAPIMRVVRQHHSPADPRDPEPYFPTALLGSGSFGSVVLYSGTRGGPSLALKNIHLGCADEPKPADRPGDRPAADRAAADRRREERRLAETRGDRGELQAHALLADRLAGCSSAGPVAEAAAACVSSAVGLRGARLARAKLGRRDPRAWTAAVMEPCDGTLADFEDGDPGAAPISAFDALELCGAVLRASRALFRGAGVAWLDAKTANVLYTRSAPAGEPAAAVRVMLGDLGGLCKVGEVTEFPTTFPFPWSPLEEPQGTEQHAAWGVVVLFAQLFSRRLLLGVPPSGPLAAAAKPFERAAWRPLSHEHNDKRGRHNALPGLLELLRVLYGCSYPDDEEARVVRDFLLDVCSFCLGALSGSGVPTASAERLTFEGVEAAMSRARAAAAAAFGGGELPAPPCAAAAERQQCGRKRARRGGGRGAPPPPAATSAAALGAVPATAASRAGGALRQPQQQTEELQRAEGPIKKRRHLEKEQARW